MDKSQEQIADLGQHSKKSKTEHCCSVNIVVKMIGLITCNGIVQDEGRLGWDLVFVCEGIESCMRFGICV